MAESENQSEQEENFISHRNQRLHRWEWKFGAAKSENPCALIFVCHGFGEHLGWYEDVVEEFSGTNCYLFGHDHLGHGLSEGDQALINNMQELVDDVRDHVVKMTERYPDKPVFIIGHSMGGLIAALVASQNPSLLRGIVMIGPLCALHPAKATPLVRFAGKIVAYFMPRMELPGTKIESFTISRKESVGEGYDKDPLVWHGAIKAKSALSLLNGTENLQSVHTTFTTPFLLQHGTEDVLCDIEGSKKFFDEVASTDKTLRIYQGFRHQVHHELEPESGETRREIKEWIMERV